MQSNKKNRKRRTYKQKRDKSIGAYSNETNQTQIESEYLINVQLLVKEKIKKDIYDYSDQISEEANEYFSRKIQAFTRIQYLLAVYFNAKIYLFGSCACGLAVKNSDIDIVIDQQYLNHFGTPQTEKIISKSLDYLAQNLETRPWIKNLKFIGTAAIPIIKLTIDTNIALYQNYMSHADYILLNSSSNKGQIDVDITVQTKSQAYGQKHLGVSSTKQICKWLNDNQSLHEITIILKYYLTINSLNQTYQGGLKTYCLVVLILAFIKSRNLEDKNDIVYTMEELLKFYGYEFDQATYGIDLNHPNVFYFKENKNQSSSAQLEIKDPNNSCIMTKSCYSYPKIKDLFKEIYEQCFRKSRIQIEQFISKLNPKEKKLTNQQLQNEIRLNFEKNNFKFIN